MTIGPSFLAARAACGESHTIFVSTSGEVWACGRNRNGQLGMDPDVVPETVVPVRVPLTDVVSEDVGSGGVDPSVEVVQAAAGRVHTMLLMSDGRVLGFGSDEFGALGVGPRTDGDVEMGSAGERAESGMEFDSGTAEPAGSSAGKISLHWQPRVIEVFEGQRIASVSAGGEQSFAIAIASSLPSAETRVPAVEREANLAAAASDAASTFPGERDRRDASEKFVAAGAATVAARGVVYDSTRKIIGGEDLLRQGSEAMFRRRRFSIPAVTPMRTADDFSKLISAVQSADSMEEEGGASSPAMDALVEASGVVTGRRETEGCCATSWRRRKLDATSDRVCLLAVSCTFRVKPHHDLASIENMHDCS